MGGAGKEQSSSRLALPSSSYVSSLLPLMNTCAAIKPFFMGKSHVRNYLVHLRRRWELRAGRGASATLCLTQPEESQLFLHKRPTAAHTYVEGGAGGGSVKK